MSDIIGVDNCTAELKRLLDEIEVNLTAAGEADADTLSRAVRTETRKLVDFTGRTEPKDRSEDDDVQQEHHEQSPTRRNRCDQLIPQDKQGRGNVHGEKCGDTRPRMVDRALQHAYALRTRINQGQFRQNSFT